MEKVRSNQTFISVNFCTESSKTKSLKKSIFFIRQFKEISNVNLPYVILTLKKTKRTSYSSTQRGVNKHIKMSRLNQILKVGSRKLKRALLFVRSSHQKCSVRKGVLRNFAKFTAKRLCQSYFFLLKKRLCHRCSPVNFAKYPTFFYRTPPVTVLILPSISDRFHFSKYSVQLRKDVVCLSLR